MRIKCSCQHCSTHLEFDAANAGAVVVCPNCQRETTLWVPGATGSKPGTGSYMIRWRGRSDGPLTLEQIDSRLNGGQLGLLTEIRVDGQWITLRDFYKSRSVEQPTNEGDSPNAGGGTTAAPGPQSEAFSPDTSPPKPRGNGKTKRYAMVAIAALVACLLGCLALASRFFAKTNMRKESSALATTQPAANRTNTPPPSPQPASATNTVAGAGNGSNAVTATLTNATTVTSGAMTNSSATTALASNISQTVEPSSLPAFPENEPRTFHLMSGTNYAGIIVSVDKTGLIIKLGMSQYTPRLAWDLFEEEALAREPKVIAYRKALEAAERARIAAAEAAERAKAEKAEAARLLAESRARQDAIIESSIELYGWKTVTKGYLKGWGSQVSIGEIFAVVAPTANWSAGKLADYEKERYTHYVVEARWTNDRGERVAMQYLVTADGSDFRLHGCFVSGSKMPDLPFIGAVKDIWNRKQ